MGYKPTIHNWWWTKSFILSHLTLIFSCLQIREWENILQ